MTESPSGSGSPESSPTTEFSPASAETPMVPANTELAPAATEPQEVAGNDALTPVKPADAPAPPTEVVLRGILFALPAILVGIVVTVLLWRLHFIGAIAAFLLAASAVWLYTKGAGAPPRRGLIAVVVLIVVGLILSFFACVTSDLITYYGEHPGEIEFTESQFVTDNLFNPEVLSIYGRDIVFLILFGALGTYSTIRRLLAARHIR